MPSSSAPQIRYRPISKSRNFFTKTRLHKGKMESFKESFLHVLRKIAHPVHPNPTNNLISFLNLRGRCSEPSLECIPSIENMLSEHNIEEEGFSKSSI